MASRTPGPLGLQRTPIDVNERTNSRAGSAVPGPAGASWPSPRNDDFRNCLSDAIGRAVKLAPNEVQRRTGLSFGDSLDGLILKIVDALGIPRLSETPSHPLYPSREIIVLPRGGSRDGVMCALGLDFLPTPSDDEPNEGGFVFPARLSNLTVASKQEQSIREYRVQKAAEELACALAVVVHGIAWGIAKMLRSGDANSAPRLQIPGPSGNVGSSANNDPVDKLVLELKKSRLDDSFQQWLRRNRNDLLASPYLLERLRIRHAAPVSDASSPSDEQSSVKDRSDDSPELTFIEILVVDEENKPVSKGKYRLELTDGSLRTGDLPANGRIRVDSIPTGDCKFSISRLIALGTPPKEVKRSWDWKRSQSGKT